MTIILKNQTQNELSISGVHILTASEEHTVDPANIEKLKLSNVYEWIWDDSIIVNDGTVDLTDKNVAQDFVRGNNINIGVTPPFPDQGGLGADYRGTIGTATKTTSTDIDFTLAEDMYLHGIELVLDKHVVGDTCSLQLVHPVDGVIREFGKDWNLVPDQSHQVPPKGHSISDLIPTGMILRVAYNSIGTVDDVHVGVNWILLSEQ